MTDFLVRWFIFGVIIALMPVIFNLFGEALSTGRFNFLGAIANGELLLISTAIAAPALGELIGSGISRNIPNLLAGGSSIVLLLLTSFGFAYISGARRSSRPLNSAVISGSSLVMFLFTISASCTCVCLANLSVVAE